MKIKQKLDIFIRQFLKSVGIFFSAAAGEEKIYIFFLKKKIEQKWCAGWLRILHELSSMPLRLVWCRINEELFLKNKCVVSVRPV